jgi:ribose transport system permease protein
MTNTVTPEAPPTQQPPRSTRLSGLWAATRHFRPVMVLVVLLFIWLSVTQQYFFTLTNIENMLTGVSILWVTALGMTFVLIAGGVDLSVGATAAITGILMAKLINIGVPGGFAIVGAIVLGGALGGGINGFLIGKLGFSFFVVTLASMTALTGAVDLWSQDATFPVNAPIANQIAINGIAGVPVPIWIMAVTWLLALFVQKFTYFGRDVFAVGGSVTAARLSGIRTQRTLIGVYAVAGAAAALGGVIGVSRIAAASPLVDSNLPLEAIAGVLLGGTALTGGAGGVGGTALGVLFIGLLQNGLAIAGVASSWQEVVTGVILVAAVSGDQLARLGRGGVVAGIRSLAPASRERDPQPPATDS